MLSLVFGMALVGCGTEDNGDGNGNGNETETKKVESRFIGTYKTEIDANLIWRVMEISSDNKWKIDSYQQVLDEESNSMVDTFLENVQPVSTVWTVKNNSVYQLYGETGYIFSFIEENGKITIDWVWFFTKQ